VNGAPRREVRGQHAPRATAAHKVQNAVYHFAHVNIARASARFGWRNEWCDDLPLLVGQVARVGLSMTLGSCPIQRTAKLYPESYIDHRDANLKALDTRSEPKTTICGQRLIYQALIPLRCFEVDFPPIPRV